ncbi:hypothetical protein ACTJJ7_15830 [Phyllobacterium sp. 22229]|uniref:hypothetical protein n=1 Tax=Phyllobacterium sp. 22229 TaxID=3453895 RepID=UPI003F85681A
MARDFDSRLQKLKARRMGPSDIQKRVQAADGSFVPIQESYQKRTNNKASMYALGAMQEVDATYTQNSFSEGDRVKNQLEKALNGNIPVAFDYQGSVPLNIHIKGVSDVDLLLLRNIMVVYDTDGARANSLYYSPWTGGTPEDELSVLRRKAERILADAFPEADLDISGSKAITISGGSLRREIDVIPAHWYDSAEYQRTLEKKDRGIFIFLKKEGARMLNYPFMHMHKINEKDGATLGNAKKIIRLLKTLIADYEGIGTIDLSSYDIASIVWHFNSVQLFVQNWNELGLLWVTKAHLDSFVANKASTLELQTPDGTRKIIDKDSKFSSLALLSIELDQLVEEVATELLGTRILTRDSLQKSLQGSFVP